MRTRRAVLPAVMVAASAFLAGIGAGGCAEGSAGYGGPYPYPYPGMYGSLHHVPYDDCDDHKPRHKDCHGPQARGGGGANHRPQGRQAAAATLRRPHGGGPAPRAPRPQGAARS